VIVYLGWGSLIWDPQDLPFVIPWQGDGPAIRVEFQRQSQDGRLTLVLTEEAALVQCLWTRSGRDSLRASIAELASREGVPSKYVATSIGVWRPGDPSPACMPMLTPWAEERRVSAVVWTALGPKLNGKAVASVSCEAALSYLEALTGVQKQRAEEYVRRAPKQIATAYRTQIERALGWTPV